MVFDVLNIIILNTFIFLFRIRFFFFLNFFFIAYEHLARKLINIQTIFCVCAFPLCQIDEQRIFMCTIVRAQGFGSLACSPFFGAPRRKTIDFCNFFAVFFSPHFPCVHTRYLWYRTMRRAGKKVGSDGFHSFGGSRIDINTRTISTNIMENWQHFANNKKKAKNSINKRNELSECN